MMYKAILSVWDFQCSFILLACQVSAGLGFCLVAMQVAPGSPLLQLKPFKTETFLASLPLGLLYVANLAVGWWGLALVDVPMFLAIRRTTTVMTMVIEFFMIGTAPSVFVRLAVGVMMLGTIVAGWESFNDDFRGYMFTLLNNLITAVQLNFAKKFRNEHDVQGFGLVFYNGLTALPVSLVLAGVLGEFEVAANFEHLTHPGFIAAVLIASVSGAFMTYVVLLCATVNSPTATSVTGNIKDIVTTFIGASLFEGFEPTLAKVLGLGISFVGGGWFSYLKLEESGALAKPAEPVKATIVAGPIEEDAFEESAVDSGDEGRPLARV